MRYALIVKSYVLCVKSYALCVKSYFLWVLPKQSMALFHGHSKIEGR